MCWQGCGEIGIFLHCWWECKMEQQPIWKTVWRFLKELKLKLQYDPAIPPLGIYPKEFEAGSRRDICTLLFTAALFAIAKRWKQLKRPSTDERINKTWYIHVMEYYSALKGRNSCHVLHG